MRPYSALLSISLILISSSSAYSPSPSSLCSHSTFTLAQLTHRIDIIPWCHTFPPLSLSLPLSISINLLVLLHPAPRGLLCFAVRAVVGAFAQPSSLPYQIASHPLHFCVCAASFTYSRRRLSPSASLVLSFLLSHPPFHHQ